MACIIVPMKRAVFYVVLFWNSLRKEIWMLVFLDSDNKCKHVSNSSGSECETVARNNVALEGLSP